MRNLEKLGIRHIKKSTYHLVSIGLYYQQYEGMKDEEVAMITVMMLTVTKER